MTKSLRMRQPHLQLPRHTWPALRELHWDVAMREFERVAVQRGIVAPARQAYPWRRVAYAESARECHCGPPPGTHFHRLRWLRFDVWSARAWRRIRRTHLGRVDRQRPPGCRRPRWLHALLQIP